MKISQKHTEVVSEKAKVFKAGADKVLDNRQTYYYSKVVNRERDQP